MTINFLLQFADSSSEFSYILLFALLSFSNTAFAQQIPTITATLSSTTVDPGSLLLQWGQVTGAVRLKRTKGDWPVDTEDVLTPPTASGEWQSKSGGVGRRKYELVNFRYRFPEFVGRIFILVLFAGAHSCCDLRRLWCHDSRRLAGRRVPAWQASPTHFRFQIY